MFPRFPQPKKEQWVSRPDPRRPLNCIASGDWVALENTEVALYKERKLSLAL